MEPRIHESMTMGEIYEQWTLLEGQRDLLRREVMRLETMNEALVDAGKAVVAERDTAVAEAPDLFDVQRALRERLNGMRLWVAEDGMTLVRIWDDIHCQVAQRSNSYETWGPPIKLNEEKT